MKLSIIMVSYNEKKYLPKAIESCLTQELEESYEIIIGDDGSNDGSIELIKSYAAKYPEKIKYFVMNRNDAISIIPSLRVSNVLKRGFSIATGQYLMVMSGDDLFCDNQKCKRQIDFLDHNSGYSSCYTDFKKFWDNGRQISVIVRSSTSNAIFWSQRYMHISCFMFKQESLLYLLDRFCDDTGLIFSIFKSGKSHHIPGEMFGYRQRDNSIMHKADQLELNILELLLFQDIKNQGDYYFSTISRFARSFKYVFKHREQLTNIKYEKYIINSNKYPNNYLEKLRDYNYLILVKRFEILILMIVADFIAMLFKLICKIDILINVILRR